MSRSEARVGALVFSLALLLYVSWRSYFFNFDGIACAIAVELGDFKHLVHGNHLSYGVVAWLFSGLWKALGYGGPAIYPMQVLSALLGAAGAAVFSSILLRAGRSAREALLGGAALAVSNAWWFWSLEAQVYMLGALFCALAAREALGEKPDARRTGAWHAAAMLGHAGHVMAAPALIYLLYRGKDRRAVGRYLAWGAGLVLAAYAAAAIFAVRPANAEEWRLWLLGSAALGSDRAFAWHGAPIGTSIAAWLLRTGEVFVASPAWLSLLPLGAAAWGLRRAGRAERFWGLWLVCYAALFMAWEPGTIVYRVTDLLAFWALADAGLQSLGTRTRELALGAWTAAALGLNLYAAVLPASLPSSNPEFTDAVFIAQNTPPEAWALAVGRGQVFIPYFGGRKPLNPRYWKDEAELFAKLDAAAAAEEPVYALDTALTASGWRASFLKYGAEPAGTGLWRIRRPAKPSRSGASRAGKAGRN